MQILFDLSISHALQNLENRHREHFVRAPGGFRFLFVMIDTFTKWMEAMLGVNIMQEAAVMFLQSIIYRFGVPRRVLTDNETQFK
jgi:hypothetical protein